VGEPSWGGGGGIRTRGGREPSIAFEAIPLWPLRYPTKATGGCTHECPYRLDPASIRAGRHLPQPGVRRPEKKSLSRAEASSASTPVVTAIWWFSRGSWTTL
jgi:hypothetical protein